LFCEKEEKILEDILISLKKQNIISDDSKITDYMTHLKSLIHGMANKLEIYEFSNNNKRKKLEKILCFSCLYIVNIEGCLKAIYSNDRNYDKISDMLIQIINQIKAVIVLENKNLYSSQLLVIRNVFELLWLTIILLNNEDLSNIYFDESIDEYNKWNNYFKPHKLRKKYLEILETKANDNNSKVPNTVLEEVFQKKKYQYKQLSGYVHNDYFSFKNIIYCKNIPMFLHNDNFHDKEIKYLLDLVDELMLFIISIDSTVLNRKEKVFKEVVPEMIYQTICRDYLIGFGINEFYNEINQGDQ
jgi:hypothetical protein